MCIRCIFLLSSLVACAGPPRPITAADPAGDTTHVRIFHAARFCDEGGTKDGSLARVVRDESLRLAHAFRALRLDVPDPVEDPTPDELRAAAAPVGRRPLLIVYSGHGRWSDLSGRVLSDEEHDAPPREPVRSTLCLRRGRLTLTELAQSFRRPTPNATVVANACFSAHVDVSDARTDLSIVSGSTGAISTPSNETPLAAGLLRHLAQPLDCDGDGHASDFDLFFPLQRPFDRQGGSPDPKLRRQLGRTPAIFRSGRTTCALAAPPLDAPATEYVYDRRVHLAFPGRAAGVPDRAIAVPCPEPVGQCFRVPPPRVPTK